MKTIYITLVFALLSNSTDKILEDLQSKDQVKVTETINNLNKNKNFHYTEQVLNVFFSGVTQYVIVQNACKNYIKQLPEKSYINIIKDYSKNSKNHWRAIDLLREVNSDQSINILINIMNSSNFLGIKNYAYESIITINNSKFIKNVVWVKSFDGLNLRKNTNINSEILVTIPYQNAVIIIKKTNKKETISGITGFWVEVIYNGFQGFAFDSFLINDSPHEYDNYHKGYITGRMAYECCLLKTNSNLESCDGGGTWSSIEYGYNSPDIKDLYNILIPADVKTKSIFPCEDKKQELYQIINKKYRNEK